MTTDTHYETDHLSAAEIKEVASAVHKHYMAVMNGTADADDMLYADPEELNEEYMFWIGKYEERLQHGEPASQDD